MLPSPQELLCCTGTGNWVSCLAPSPSSAKPLCLSWPQRSHTQPGVGSAQARFHSQAELSEHKLICDPHIARTTKGDIDSTPCGLSG